MAGYKERDFSINIDPSKLKEKPDIIKVMIVATCCIAALIIIGGLVSFIGYSVWSNQLMNRADQSMEKMLRPIR